MKFYSEWQHDKQGRISILSTSCILRKLYNIDVLLCRRTTSCQLEHWSEFIGCQYYTENTRDLLRLCSIYHDSYFMQIQCRIYAKYIQISGRLQADFMQNISRFYADNSSTFYANWFGMSRTDHETSGVWSSAESDREVLYENSCTGLSPRYSFQRLKSELHSRALKYQPNPRYSDSSNTAMSTVWTVKITFQAGISNSAEFRQESAISNEFGPSEESLAFHCNWLFTACHCNCPWAIIV